VFEQDDSSYILRQTQHIPCALSDVFAFFSDAGNLERLTPPLLGFEILTPSPIDMKSGTVIDYRIRLYGIPLNWKTLIEEVSPEESFVDTQVKGPYALWHHTHTFAAVDGGTLMNDIVRYRLPLGPLGHLAHSLFVRRTLKTIFDYRRAAVEEIFSEEK